MGTHNLIRDKNRDQVPIKMKVFATFVASTFAQNGIETNHWPANEHAPHCGCQILIDTEASNNQYINKTCSLSFNYPLTYSNDYVDPHFVSVASSFMVGRDRSGDSSKFIFTGYDEVSNAAQLDILVFYEQNDCYRAGVQVPESWDEVEQSTIWEYYNMTTQQSADLCNFELTCTDTGAVEGVHLGNFNYDIARSVQTYTVPIYGLQKGQSATFEIRDYNDEANNCMNDTAQPPAAPPTPPMAAPTSLLLITIRITMVFWNISNLSPFLQPTTPLALLCQFTTLTTTSGRPPRHGTHNKPMPILNHKLHQEKFNHVHIRKTQNQHMTTNKD